MLGHVVFEGQPRRVGRDSGSFSRTADICKPRLPLCLTVCLNDFGVREHGLCIFLHQTLAFGADTVWLGGLYELPTRHSTVLA